MFLLIFTVVTMMVVIVQYAHYMAMTRYRREMEHLLIAIGQNQINHTKMWLAVVGEETNEGLQLAKAALERDRLELELALDTFVESYQAVMGLPKHQRKRR